MEHAHKEERENGKRHEIEKTRVMRVRTYEELREAGEQKKRTIRENENIYKIGHLRFEEAFELNSLGLLLIIGCWNSLCFDKHTLKNSTRGIIQQTFDFLGPGVISRGAQLKFLFILGAQPP